MSQTQEQTRSLPIRVDKPWGNETIFAWTERYVGKILFIRAGQSLSLQYHRQKDETIYVSGGKMEFEVDEGEGLVTRTLNPGDFYHIRPEVKHRMRAAEDCTVFEVSTPELDDVVRLQDLYGRVGK